MTAAAVSILLAALQVIGISGDVPAEVGPLDQPGRVLWLPADPAPDADVNHECALTTASRWSCPSVPAGQPGVALIIGDGIVGYVVRGPVGALSGKAEWGRVVRVATGAIGSVGLRDLQVASWSIDRPANRPNTRKLDVVPDSSIQVIKISNASYWVSGSFPSADAFLHLEGPGVARHDTAMAEVVAGPLESPFVIDADKGVSITGRVETRSGDPVEGALLELFAISPAVVAGPKDEKALAKVPVIRLATVVADGEGRFEFSDLENGSYEVVATAFSRGRLSRWTTTASPPVVMKLEAPATATGRVVRQKLPAPNVKVRFVPASSAWRNSTDPSAHLTADVRTGDDGRFALALPPEASGDVQFIAPDGASARVTLPAASNFSEIRLGDIPLPEMIAVEVRANAAGCRMTAIGPAGALGLAVVPARTASTIYQFELPEAGQWFLDAECAGQPVSLQPVAIQVKRSGSISSFDVNVVR